MELSVGAIMDGKVTGITKFGAFVALPEGKSGLVHISEIAYSYVNEVSDHLHEGQEVKVKIIGIDQSNRINLSIKQVEPPPQRAPRQGGVEAAVLRVRAAVRPARWASSISLLRSPPTSRTGLNNLCSLLTANCQNCVTSKRRAETAAAADAGKHV